MKSYKDILNERSQRSTALRQLTETEAASLKRLLVQMLTDLATLCDRHGLRWMISGGSCLGAIRHQGFIPWDDDLDVSMPRRDVEQLRDLLDQGELGDQYEYTCPNSGHEGATMFMKIFRKGTRMVELGQEHSPFPKGVFIDIFILDGAPSSVWKQRLKGLVANTLRLCANMVLEASYPQSELQRQFFGAGSVASLTMKVRRGIGCLLKVVPHKWWINAFDRFVRDDDTESGLTTFPTGRALYGGEILPYDVFVPTRRAMFEGMEVNLPRQAEVYLANLYGGDYMQLPPEDKRERHFIVDFQL